MEIISNEFKNLPVDLPSEIEKNTKHAYHLFNICLDQNKTNIKEMIF